MPDPTAEGELKQVTVLFADIRGSTRLIQSLDPEAALQQLEPAIKLMADAVHRAGGVVNKRQGDGIMALFGVPNASEDHAVRACRAGRAMLDGLASLADPLLELRVGAASGSAVVRATGTDETDYDAIGPVVHLAARMEQTAEPGRVQITDQTARLASGFISVKPLPALQVKGIDEPVRAYALLAVTDRPSWEARSSAHALTPMVGRETELMQMRAVLRRVARGQGQALTLVGEPGVGKSRLMHEFLQELGSETWRVLRASATQQTSASVFQVAADLLRSLAGIGASDSAADAAARLDAAGDGGGEDWAADSMALRWLLDLPVTDTNWLSLPGDLRRNRMVDAMCRIVLRHTDRTPMVAVIEDFHWVDNPSIGMLAAMVGRMGGSRLLLLVSTRPERRPAWSGRSYATELDVGPLEPASAKAMLLELLGPSGELASLHAKILEKAEGTPLFLEEIARSLLESGSVVTQRVQSVMTRELDEIQIPASVQAILASRIDRLPPERRRLLQLASVVGKNVSRGLLAQLSGLSDAVLDAELFELQNAELLYETSFSGGGDYTFKHALTQAVTYEGMLKRQRRKLHADVFHVLEAMPENHPERQLEALAQHALAGEVWLAGVSYAKQAAERANRNCAWREAVQFLESALGALAQISETQEMARWAVDIRMELRVALAAMSDLRRLRVVLAEAHEIELRTGNARRLARIDVSRCLNLTMVGELDPAYEAGCAAVEAIADFADPSLTVSSSFALGQVHWFRGELRRAMAVLRAHQHDALADGANGASGTTGTASVLYLTCLMRNHVLAGEFDEARAIGEDVQRIVALRQRPFDVAESGQAEGLLALACGRPDQAVERLQAALAIARSSDSALLLPIIASVLGLALVATGAVDEADALLAEALAQTERHGYVAMRLCCAPARALVALHGDPALGRKTVLTELELARVHGFGWVEAMLLQLLAGIADPDAQRDEAASQAEAAAARVGIAPGLLQRLLAPSPRLLVRA